MRLLPLLVFITFGIAPLSAQGPGGMGGGMGGGGMRGGGMGGRSMMGRRRPADAPSSDLIQGPFAPDSMVPKFALDSTQGTRYRMAWDSMMTATAPVRDSIRAMIDERRRAHEEGFQHIGLIQDDVIQKLAKELKKDEARFDKVIKHVLTKDQWGDFQDWRDRRRATERELREQARMDGPEGGMGGRRPRN